MKLYIILDEHFHHIDYSKILNSLVKIPGFYFDPDKKRYFRVTPGHNRYNPITLDSIAINKQQTSYEKRYQNQFLPLRHWKRKANNDVIRHICQRQLFPQQPQHTAKTIARRAMPDYLHLSNLATWNSTTVYKLISDNVCRRIAALSTIRGNDGPFLLRIITVLENYNNSIENEYYLECFEVSSSLSRMTHVDWIRKDSKIGSIYDIVYPKTIITFYNYFLSCRTLLEKEILKYSPQHSSYYIYASHLGNASCTGSIRLHNFNDIHADVIYQFAKRSIWCCSACPHFRFCDFISVGASGEAMMLNIESNKKISIPIFNESDVFSQALSMQDPIIYNGTRGGVVQISDLRQANVVVSHVKHESSVSKIKLLNDNNYVLSSSVDGQIKLWDMRTRSCVITMSHGCDTYFMNQTFDLDNTESVVSSVGKDFAVRGWNLNNGEELYSFLPDKCIPLEPHLICYSHSRDRDNGLPILMMSSCLTENVSTLRSCKLLL
ncbi:DDB1- and CUL4-associated factor 4 [Trichoplax sp. H2]|nr:DDB1- and CUL4-associated factor 4 [Trichoplax sp. H2]|eukprot:RDD40268.1 DDB1- and CUL4-associated factor 4 [Trichoplax sp. H2]